MMIDYVKDYEYIYYDKINLENMKFEGIWDQIKIPHQIDF